MSNDIRSILDRLATVEGRLTPGQQRVPQMPALFKPHRTALEEAMAEIEEDMISKVKKDLTQYLDQLEKKVRVDRDLKDKAQDAVARGDVEEEIDTDPAAMQGPSDPGDTEVAHAAELDVANTLSAPQAPVATFEMADGAALECWGNDNQGYEIRHGQRALPSRFKSLDDAGMAVKLYHARRQAQQRNSDADYIEER